MKLLYHRTGANQAGNTVLEKNRLKKKINLPILEIIRKGYYIVTLKKVYYRICRQDRGGGYESRFTKELPSYSKRAIYEPETA
jgi:hypothetical protein